MPSTSITRFLPLSTCFFLLASLCSLPSPGQPPTASEDLVAQVGERIQIPIRGPLRFERSKVAKPAVAGKNLELLAQKPGTFQFWNGSQSFELQVLTRVQTETLRLLRRWTSSRLGLRSSVRDGQVRLEGVLVSAEDWLGLQKKCRTCDYTMEADIPYDLRPLLESKLSNLWKSDRYPVPRLRWGPPVTALFGGRKVPSGLQSELTALGIRSDLQAKGMDLVPTVRANIFILEMRKDLSRQWGLQWPSQIAAQLIPAGPLLREPLSVLARAWEDSGEAKVLASPQIICRSGESAEFLAGGEFPIRVSNRKNAAVVWRKHGIHLKLKPLADEWGRMKISLEAEVSNIDGSRTVDGIPGLLTHRVHSHFDLEQSRPIVISGLFRQDQAESSEGLIGLRKLPILGSLFSSREFRNHETELVVMVQPEVLATNADSVLDSDSDTKTLEAP